MGALEFCGAFRLGSGDATIGHPTTSLAFIPNNSFAPCVRMVSSEVHRMYLIAENKAREEEGEEATGPSATPVDRLGAYSVPSGTHSPNKAKERERVVVL